MNGSQMILVIGSIILFSLVALSINNSLRNSTDQTTKAEYLAMATNVAQSYINLINTKDFDQKTIGDPAYTPGMFTSPDSLGPDHGEHGSSQYNDIDDYNGFTDSDTTGRTGIFNIRVNVNYVNDNSLSQISNVQTRTKRIEVEVTNPNMIYDNTQDTVKIYYYKCY